MMIRTDRYSLSKFFSRISYYARSAFVYSLPRKLYSRLWQWRYASLSDEDRAESMRRAAYYCRLPQQVKMPGVGEGLPSDLGADFGGAVTLVGHYHFQWRARHRLATYFFDLYRELATFPSTFRMSYLFGDVRAEAPQPAFVKSRPITGEPTRSVLCRLNSVRHFRFVNDPTPWLDKRDMLVFRGVVTQEHRKRFVEMYYNHPLCDVGCVNSSENDEDLERCYRPYLSISQQLQYRYVACIEGNDVATSLKWVMSSNSIAVMPPPTCESWFMEGQLQPNVHYIAIRPDYSDLPERLAWYSAHPDEAERILASAHTFVARFTNQRLEHFTQRLVLGRYFQQTGQL